MLDEENLRRLAEMGIDVYVPRAAAERAASVASPARSAASDEARATAQSSGTDDGMSAAQAQATVVLLADATSASARGLIADVVRALGFASIACVCSEARDEGALATASALVMFGDRQVRAAGAVLPAQRQREIGWVAVAELATLAGDGSAKRALWSELKRMVRELAARRAPARR